MQFLVMQSIKPRNFFIRFAIIGIYVLFFITTYSSVFAGAYSTSISPSGAQISNPVTATFNIQDFAQRDYGTQCVTGFVPAEMKFNYWFDEGSNFNEISPPVIPTGEMIETGIYSATFNLPVGQAVDSIGVEFFQYEGEGGARCSFYGRQPDGASEEPWLEPVFTVVEAEVDPVIIHIPVTRSFQNNLPSVSFINFPAGEIWSGKKDIKYSAVDYDPSPFDLKDFPINFYLSNDGGTIWKELSKNETNSGTYSFDTNNFPDGVNYKIKIIAFDNKNESGEIVSGVFSIDNAPPTFDVYVEAESKLIKEKDKIKLKIVSSENLTETPSIQVTQSGAEPQTLSVDGFGKNFSASYAVLKGHLGTAVIAIKGKDSVGNIGKEVISGETFIVNRLGPPPLVIKNIADNESFSEPKIDIFGIAPSAREVIFIFNDKDKFKIKPQDNGEFNFKDIILSSLNFGINTLRFSSVDNDGIESDSSVLTVKLNSPPNISWTKSPAGILSGSIKLEWESSDANNDTLVYSLWYSADGGKNWNSFSKGLLDNKYEINTGEFFDGDNYFIKVIVDDGTTNSEILSEKIIFKNSNLFSIRNAPKNHVFDTIHPIFEGDIRISENAIVSLRYSLEEEAWSSAEAVDGKFDSSFEKFLIKFPDTFIDGKHILFIESEDDKGTIFRTIQSFVIDTIPPLASEIVFPSQDETINGSYDNDLNLGGIQVDILGTAEAGTDLELSVNNRTYATDADSKGKFIFKKVTFLSRGINRYVLSSSDAVGNVSKAEGFIISNNTPELFLLSPQKGDFLSGNREIKWRAGDGDGDELVFQVSYRRRGNKDWILLESDLAESSYKMDTSGLKEGAYELQIIANDGLTEIAVVEEIFIDNMLPTIGFDLTGPVSANGNKLLFSGNANDNLSGVKFVEYSIDGKAWFKAIIAEGYLQKKASFVIRHPFELEDGEYDFGVRAIDAAGNISKPNFEKIIVDSTPPRVGSFNLSYGTFSILPSEDGFVFPESVELSLAISLERDTRSASIVLFGSRIDLLKNKSTGLWEADILANQTGTSTIAVSAEDISGNIIRNKAIGQVVIAPSGQTIGGAKISVFSRDEENQSLSLWPASAYGAKNPVYADENGKYILFLPAGKYQILVEKDGFQRLRISDFEILNSRFINFDLLLKPRAGIRGFLENILEKISL